MAKSRNSQLLDMGGSNFNELISRKVTEINRDNLYIAIPAKVVGISEWGTTQCVDVRPVIDDVYLESNGTTLKASTLNKVFVRLPSFGGYTIKFPVKVGDMCVLHYSHKALDQWFSSTGEINLPQSIAEVAGLNDCWVEMGFGTRSNNQSPSATDFSIGSDTSSITFKESGDIVVDSGGVGTPVTVAKDGTVFSGNVKCELDLALTTTTAPSGLKGFTGVVSPDKTLTFEAGLLVAIA